MSRTALPLNVSQRLYALIEQEQNRRNLDSHLLLRFRIIYHSLEDKRNIDIANSLHCHEKTVRKWRNRFWEHQQALMIYEQGHDSNLPTDKELVDKMKEILSDAPRSGAPARLSESDIKRLIVLACEKPEKYGLPFTSWTHNELAKQAQKMGILLSSVHLGRILKKRLTPAQK